MHVLANVGGSVFPENSFSYRRAPHRRAHVCQRRALTLLRLPGLRSTVGRPRRVTDAQIRVILAWRAQVVAWKAARRAVKTIRQLACELQLSMATISDVIRKHGLFKQPSPELREAAIHERRATLHGLRIKPRRTLTLSDAQTVAIHRWWSERQALRRQMQAMPSKAQMARELGMARGTLDRILTRAGRPSSDGVASGAGRRVRRLSHRQEQRLRAWQRNREALQLQSSRVPGTRTFARRLGISVSMLLRTVSQLNRQR